jgi:GntR family transcriptional repressor for pyruvate dehydrogenase complex
MLATMRRADRPTVRLEPVRRGWVYERIVDQIRALIRDGRWAPGDQLPTERDLAQRMRVSRASVRGAMRALASQGVIETRKRRRYLRRSIDEAKLMIPVLTAACSTVAEAAAWA